MNRTRIVVAGTFVLSLLFPVLAAAQTAPVRPQTPQGPAGAQARESRLLAQQLGLTGAQVTQVLAIQKNTLDRLRANRVHITLFRAQIAEALLPRQVDQMKVNGLIDQIAQSRGDSQKALIDAQIKLRQIMGDAAFQRYRALLRSAVRERSQRGFTQRSQRSPRSFWPMTGRDPAPFGGGRGAAPGRPNLLFGPGALQ